jgi:hypothetical protein
VERFINFFLLSFFMEKDNVLCRIWASETSPTGHEHRCHAENTGLAEGVYPKGEIEKVLRTKPTWGGTWHMLACEPNHDGTACEDCQYKNWKGLSHYYDLKQQREILMEAKRKGADIRYIE